MLKLTLRILFVGFLLLLPACSKSLEKAVPVTNKANSTLDDSDKLRKWHDVCLEGDTDKIDQQIKKFEAELKATPNNNLARAYLGSAYALKAKYSFFPTTKLNSLKKGRSLMEAAVAGSPNNPRVRMVRAIAYYKVPKRFRTRATSVADFEKLLGAIKEDRSDLRANEKQVILYYAFLAFTEAKHKSTNEAKTMCHKINPKSSYGKLTK